MADMKLQSNPSGSGTFTVQPPNSNNTRTLTLPDVTGNLLSDTSSLILPKGVPAFKARMPTTQSISHNTTTIPNYTSEVFDIGGFYNAVNRTYTPTISGYYQFTHRWVATITGSRNYYFLAGIRKNGTTDAQIVSTLPPVTLGLEFGLEVSTVMFMNGTTDYAEPVIYTFDYTASGAVTLSAGVSSEFFGSLVSAT